MMFTAEKSYAFADHVLDVDLQGGIRAGLGQHFQGRNEDRIRKPEAAEICWKGHGHYAFSRHFFEIKSWE